MNKIFLSLLLLIVSIQIGQAQTLQAWLEAANEAYEKKDYYSAYKYYEVVIEYDSSMLLAWDRYANSAVEFGAFSSADAAYTQLRMRDTDKKFPFSTFLHAETKLYLGQYDQAQQLYEQFLTDNQGKNSMLTRRAEDGIEKCTWATDWLGRPTKDTVYHTGPIINSRYSDFGAAAIGDTLYFSSLRFINKKDSLEPPRAIIKLLQYNPLDSTATKLPDNFNTPGKHVGHTTFNRDYSKIYYTECSYLNVSDIQCTLMVRERGPGGEWVNPKVLPVNETGFTNTHPNIGFDSTLMKEVLYFVSDRPGPNGEGNLDIWRSVLLEDGKYTKPEHFDLNTQRDDVTPFFDTPTQTLYFSSDGYIGFGGFDVLKASRTALGWSEPENIKFPINSSYNDLYYGKFINGSKVYFASNRPDSLALFWDESHDACCNDIYVINYETAVFLRALTYDLQDSNALAGVTVALYRIGPNGEEVLVDTKLNKIGNEFGFFVEPNMQYKLVATKDGYSSDSSSVDLTDVRLHNVGTIERKLYLDPPPPLRLTPSTYEETADNPLAGTTVELYELTPGGPILITSAFNPDGHEFDFPVEPGKKYLVKGTKPGYTTDTDTIDLSTPALMATADLSPKLILKRDIDPRAGAKLPPIALRVSTFDTDNTQPLPGTLVELLEPTPEGFRLITAQEDPVRHTYTFPIIPGKQYLVKGSKLGYESDRTTLDLTTLEIEPGTTIERELILTPPPPIELDVTTFLNNPSNPLPGVTVELYEETPDGPKLIGTKTNTEGNDFNFPLIRGKKYKIVGKRNGFTTAENTVDLTDPRLMKMKKIERELILNRKLDGEPGLEILTYEGDTLTPLNGVAIELIKLRDGVPETPDIQFNESGNDFLYPLELRVPYIVRAIKPGFETFVDTTIFLPNAINPLTNKIELALIMNRESFEDFLPLALYFDNDRPNPRTRRRTTEKAYPEVYQPYYDRKEAFIKAFTEGKDEEEAFLLREGFDNFFEREVNNGYRDLLDFSARLYDYLNQGNAIEIEIQGYCSPRGQTSYNDILSERRIDCVINHFERFQNGALKPFIQSKKLMIKVTPQGERTASQDISDKFDDERNSIFSILASVERRVEIIEVRTTINR